MNSTCPSCGARVSENQSQCDLCGTSLSASDGADGSPRPGKDDSPSPSAIQCRVCGSSNPEGSRFCNRCGSRIEGVRTAASLAGAPIAETADRPTGDEGRSEQTPVDGNHAASDRMMQRVLFTIGAGLLLMIGLYGITLFSEGQSNGSPTASAAARDAPQGGGGTLQPSSTAPPLSDDVANEAESLKQSIQAASDPSERLRLRRELVALYVDAGRYDMAGQAQENIAETVQTAAAWADAGNLYYDWMMRQSGRQRVVYAKRAIAAYKRSLELNPDNLDVRAAMGLAYLYDPDNPMQAIRQTNMVLAQDSTHVEANFNRGIMLLQIGRTEQAAAQFEKVMRLTDPGTPHYQHAQQVLQRIR